jgi:dihydroorotase
VAMIEEARESGFPVTVDVTAHHLHLSEHDIGAFNAQCHVQPPLRGRRDRDALRSGLTAGTIDAICSDHQPHEVDAKLKPFGESAAGISGLETLLPLTLQLVADGVLDLASALAKVTCGPARILGIEAGQLAAGARADVCVFDPHAERVIDAGRFTSRGRNTPFGGWTLPGEVTHTLIGGRIVHGAESGSKN